MKKFRPFLLILLAGILTLTCKQDQSKSTSAQATVPVDDRGYAVLTDEQMEDLVRRSYPYVAMYNVNNKFAISQGGWNTLRADTALKDHTITEIARPNNDSFYTGVMLDLRKEPMIVSWPAFDSKYVSLMVTAYDHYVHVPKTTRLGDFRTPEHMLFYSEHTEGYKGEPIEGIETIFKANGDFISAVFRVMPHVSEPNRFESVKAQIGQIRMQSLSEFQGREPLAPETIAFPQVGKSDLDIFENNFLEVMQFVFNHLSFDENYELDRALLAAFKPLGVAPGNEYDPQTAVKIDGVKLREVAQQIVEESLATMSDPSVLQEAGPKMFKPKGKTDLRTLTIVSVTGPIGLPMEEAYYPPVNTKDGAKMNALNDYVIRMNREELPPAEAFWSLTLYDTKTGLFLPNDRKKYSVGENAGMKLNREGGIEIFVAAEQPDGVPLENWLPITRQDQNLDIILRIYVPDLAKLPAWKPPVAEKL